MNPNPLAPLNHFTTPCSFIRTLLIVIGPSTPRSARFHAWGGAGRTWKRREPPLHAGPAYHGRLIPFPRFHSQDELLPCKLRLPMPKPSTVRSGPSYEGRIFVMAGIK